jgi:hypothetical protein
MYSSGARTAQREIKFPGFYGEARFALSFRENGEDGSRGDFVMRNWVESNTLMSRKSRDMGHPAIELL